MRLTSRCPLQASSWWSWHQIPTGKQHTERQMVKETHHKVDPCPLCAPGQMICSKGENFLHISDTLSSVFICQWPARAVLSKYQESLSNISQRWRTWSLRCEEWCAARPEPRTSQLYALRQRPLGELPKDLQPSVRSLIPLDLHSCL